MPEEFSCPGDKPKPTPQSLSLTPSASHDLLWRSCRSICMGPSSPIPALGMQCFPGKGDLSGAHTPFDAVSFQPCLGPDLCSQFIAFSALCRLTPKGWGVLQHTLVWCGLESEDAAIPLDTLGTQTRHCCNYQEQLCMWAEHLLQCPQPGDPSSLNSHKFTLPALLQNELAHSQLLSLPSCRLGAVTHKWLGWGGSTGCWA